MKTDKTPKPSYRPPIEGTVRANIQLPVPLTEAMKAIRHERHKLEGADVKLCRIYREAVEQYVNSAPQQELLAGAKRLRRSA